MLLAVNLEWCRHGPALKQRVRNPLRGHCVLSLLSYRRMRRAGLQDAPRLFLLLSVRC